MAPRAKKDAAESTASDTWTAKSVVSWLTEDISVDLTKTPEPPAEGADIEGAPGIAPSVKSGRILMPSIMETKHFKDLQSSIDAVEKNLDFYAQQHCIGGHIEDSIPTGCLSYDLAMGGGLPIGKFVSHAGPEASGKSTLFNTVVPWAVNHNIPVYWFDPESARDPAYAERIFNRFGCNLLDMQGRRSKDGKKWETLPMVRYTNHHVGEDIFNAIVGILLSLPEVKQDQNGKWWERPQGASAWVESATGGLPQFLFLIDSFPAMLPELVQESLESGEDKSGGLALQARMFSANLLKIKSALTSRRCTLLGNNQLRTVPMAKGDPWREPGGEALKFYSDARFRITRIAPSTAGAKKTEGGAKYNEEMSISGGIDRYTYSKLENTKNKMFTPHRTGAIRIRMEHDGRPGDGIDMTYDALNYLEATGQLLRRHGGRFELQVRGATDSAAKPEIYGANYTGTTMYYKQLKEIIEAPENNQGIWKHCLRQIRTGYAFDLERLFSDSIAGTEVADTTQVLEVG